MKRRGALLWLALFAIYAAGAGIDALPGAGHDGAELAHLRTAESLGEGAGAGEAPGGVGFPLAILPAEAAGGSTLVELWMAAIAALGFAVAAAIARRVVPEPYATGGTLAAALSAPAIAYGTAVRPELVAGAALAGAALLALRLWERPRAAEALWAGVLLAALPWLGPQFAVPGVVVLTAMVVWLLRRGRSLPALLATELVAASVLAYFTVNDRLYDRLTPAVDPSVDLGRAPRLLSIWVDADHGALRWTPALALAAVGAYALWRSQRSRVARAVPERRDAERAAALAMAAFLAVVAVAVFATPSLEGRWFGPRHLVAGLPLAAVPIAWGLQRLPRAGGALAAASVLLGVSLLAALRTGLVDAWTATDWPLP